MKNTFVSFITVSMLLSAFCLVTGCQESETAIVQKAKLVAAENIELKKQIDTHKTEITDLKQQLKECDKKIEDTAKQANKTNNDLLKMVGDLVAEIENLKQENLALKKQTNQLQPEK